MKFILNKDKLTIEQTKEETQNSGSVKYYEADVEFDESWEGLTIEARIAQAEYSVFADEGKGIAVINNKVFIDNELSGSFGIGFVGYKIEDNVKTYQISTNLQSIWFEKGAGEIKVSNEVPNVSEWEIYIAQIKDMLDEYSGVPKGGTTGQALVKKSNTDGDVEWKDVSGISNIYIGDNEPTDESNIWIDTDDVDVDIPSKTSELVNDSGFIDNSVNTLQNYYNKMNMDKMLEDIWDMLGGSLPSGYKKVEYLQGTGTQYIDLGFMPHTGIVAKGKYTGFVQPLPLGISTPMGVMSSSSNRFDLFSFGSTTIDSVLTPVFGLGYTTYSFTNKVMANGQVYEVESALKDGEQYLKVDGNTIFTNNVSGSIEATANMLLFNRYKNGSLDTGWYEGKIYYVKIWQDNVLIRDMIPCLDINNIPCFYDRVNKQTYYNAGTGEFIYGTVEIPSSYTRCKYLESSGTQYIDTELIATVNTGMSINYSYNQIDSETAAGLTGIYKGTSPREDTLFVSTSSGKTDSPVCLFSRGTTLSTGTTLIANAMYNTKINWLNDNTLNFDNGASTNTVGTNNVTSRNIILFGRDSGGTYTFTKARIYSCKFSENNSITHDLVPCLDANNVPCFYDTITKQTYYNEGTGTFTYEVL